MFVLTNVLINNAQFVVFFSIYKTHIGLEDNIRNIFPVGMAMTR